MPPAALPGWRRWITVHPRTLSFCIGDSNVRSLITLAFLAASSTFAGAQAVSVPNSQAPADPTSTTDVNASAPLPKEGDHGESVFALQVALDRARFSPGAIDGHF